MKFKINRSIVAIVGLERIYIMERKKLDRISALAKKKKAEGLTDAELREQKALYAEYLGEIRKNFRQTLESIELTD